MESKRGIALIVVVVTILLLIGSIYSVNSVLAEDANTSTPDVPSLLQATEEIELSESAQLLRQYTSNEIQTVSVNSVDISASNFRIEENKFKADVCFQTPTKDEWLYRDSQVFFENKEIIYWNAGTTFSKVTTLKNGQTIFTTFLGNPPQKVREEIQADSIPDYRCDTLIFNLGKITPTAKFEMKIDALLLVPSESEGCLEYGEQVRELLNLKEMEIEFDCEKTEFASRFVVTKKPDSISQEEAQNIVSNAYSEILTIQGPWLFFGELTEEPKLDTNSQETVEETEMPTSTEAVPTP